jgi:hypothetical protein
MVRPHFLRGGIRTFFARRHQESFVTELGFSAKTHGAEYNRCHHAGIALARQEPRARLLVSLLERRLIIFSYCVLSLSSIINFAATYLAIFVGDKRPSIYYFQQLLSSDHPDHPNATTNLTSTKWQCY